MLTFILLFTVFLCSLHYYFYYNNFAKQLLKIPGPPIKFLFGNSLGILKPPVKLFSLADKWALDYNGIYRLFAFNCGFIFLYNANDIEIIASSMKYHEKSMLYTFMKPWLNEGLLLSNESKWQHRRKILTPAFHFNVLQKYYVAVLENSQRLVKVLEELENETIDVIPVLSEYTLNTVCETAMGTKLNEQSSSAGKSYKKAINELSVLLLYRIINIALHSEFIFKLSSNHRKQSKNLDIVHKFTANVIKQRKEKNENIASTINGSELNINKENEEYLPKNKKERLAMLDLLISAERAGLIDEAGIQEEVDTFMFEGHDTTATGLNYCLMSLASEQEIQAKIVKELDSIFGNDTRPATMEDLNKMKYLERCIKESLRLYPPVPFISRSLTTDTVLSGYKVPAGTVCVLQIYYLHRQESLFKNALKFDPDRFLPENSVGRHNYAYLPFSAGPRNCIGQKFAMMIMKSALSSILRNFKLVPVTKSIDLQLMVDLLLRNAGPIHVKFLRR